MTAPTEARFLFDSWLSCCLLVTRPLIARQSTRVRVAATTFTGRLLGYCVFALGQESLSKGRNRLGES